MRSIDVHKHGSDARSGDAQEQSNKDENKHVKTKGDDAIILR